MGEQAMWQEILSTNTPVVLALFVAGMWLSIYMFKTIIKQRTDIETAHIDALLNRIDALVSKIDALFTKYDDHERRIDTLEKKYGEHFARCVEREKSINDRFKTVHHRVSEPINNLGDK